MQGFQTQINADPAYGIEGDWSSANPRFSMLAGPGRLIAGPAGVKVGRFAWANPNGVVSNSGGQGRLGFVHRDQRSFITDWLAQTTLTVNPGLEMGLHVKADVWARFAAGAKPDQKVYANYADGTAYAAATATPPQAASFTAAIAASTGAFTGSIEGNVLTISAVGAGVAVPGGIIAGAGVVAGTQIVDQIDGTTGGIGHYHVNYPQTIASEALTETYGTLTVSAVASGALGVGDLLAGAGVTAGTQIMALGTGLGQTGTYIVSPTQTVGSEAMTATGALETAWFVETYAAPGEIAKISTRG